MSDRKPSSSIVLLALTFLLTSCASTTLKDTWKDRQFQGPAFKKIMVVAFTKRPEIRQRIEDEFAGQLNTRGVNAMTCYSIIPDPKDLTREEIVKAVSKTGVEGVLVMGLRQAGSVRTESPSVRESTGFYLFGAEPPSVLKLDEVVTISTRLFDARTGGKLVWFTNSETVESGKLDREIASLSEVIVDRLHKDKLL